MEIQGPSLSAASSAILWKITLMDWFWSSDSDVNCFFISATGYCHPKWCRPHTGLFNNIRCHTSQSSEFLHWYASCGASVSLPPQTFVPRSCWCSWWQEMEWVLVSWCSYWI